MQEGDVVKLKSGGPKMTIGSVDQTLNGVVVRCLWFLDNRELKQGNFSLESLEKA